MAIAQNRRDSFEPARQEISIAEMFTQMENREEGEESREIRNENENYELGIEISHPEIKDRILTFLEDAS
jgi:hypothetical protein